MVVPDSDVESWGGEIRYALLEGGVTLPAVGLRAGHVALSGVDQLDPPTTSVGYSGFQGRAVPDSLCGFGPVLGGQ